MREPVLYDLRDQVAWVTLNTPENRNAMSESTILALEEALRRALADGSARAIVLGAKGQAFCAGADLKSPEGAGFAPVPGDERPPAFTRVVDLMWHSPKPVLGQVQGSAFGAGVSLITAMDVVVCVNDAQFAINEILLGLAPHRLPLYLHQRGLLGVFRKLMLTGERFSAEAAREMGLVHEVVPRERLGMTVAGELRKLLRCAPRAWSELKAYLTALPDMSFDEGTLYGQRLRARLYEIGEIYEGKAAFRERRPPAWAPKP